MAIKAFAKQMNNLHIMLFMDNATAVAQVNKKSSTASKLLLLLATEMWEFCKSRNILGSSAYIPGNKSRGYVILKLDRVQQLDDGQIRIQSDRASVREDGSRFIC